MQRTGGVFAAEGKSTETAFCAPVKAADMSNAIMVPIKAFTLSQHFLKASFLI